MNYFLYSNGKQITDSFFLEDFEAEEVGIFESLRTYNGKIFRLQEHLKRFWESAKTAGVKIPFTLQELSRELVQALKAFQKANPVGQEAFLRPTLWRNRIFILVGERRLPGSIYKEGVCLKTSPVRRSLSNAAAPEVKTTAYQNAAFASLEDSGQATFEWVFLDANGFVTEVRIGNLFMVKAGQLLTPPEAGILNGVTRRFVINCAHQLRIPILEVPLTRHDIYNAEEAFLTNTSWEILPVRELDGRRIGNRIPGLTTIKLQKIFKQEVLKECPKSKSKQKLKLKRK